VIPSDVDLDTDNLFHLLVDYVRGGGGLAVFYHSEDGSLRPQFQMNELLSVFGLSFTFCTLNEQIDKQISIPVPHSYDQVKDMTFRCLVQQFGAAIDGADLHNVDSGKLDVLATDLRYHIRLR
jgi:hypothetical protein